MAERKETEPSLVTAPIASEAEVEFCAADDSSDDSEEDSPIVLPPVPRSRTNSVVEPVEDTAPAVKMSSISSQDTQDTHETRATTVTQPTLGPLQEKGPGQESREYEPVDEDDPQNFDLTAPALEHYSAYSLEARSLQLFSREHLEIIFSEPSLLLKFTNYLSKHRPQSIPMLIYYLDALKALRAVAYANAVSEGLEPLGGHDFTHSAPEPSKNLSLEGKTAQAFDVLVREDLPAFITHTYVNIVSLSIQRRITGTLAPHLREASEGLAEVFCLTDFSRPDNPIVFSSEEFHRTTQYGLSYVIGRNCRFLQGPKTDRDSVRRIGEAIKLGKEHQEVFLNYRRDGSPFMNLLTLAPLCDSRGKIRYFIGAQVDVSGLVKDCTDLESLERMVRRARRKQHAISDDDYDDDEETINGVSQSPRKDEFQELSEMLNVSELETVRTHGGRMHSELADADDRSSARASNRPRLLIKEPSSEMDEGAMAPLLSTRGRLPGVYQHYLLLRPYPSLRVLFTSPSLRVPGLLQSPFLTRVGGSQRVRDELVAALAEGRNVTAKIRWLNRFDDEGRNRWVHCTPLIGSNGAVGSWMVVLVDDEREIEKKRMGGEAGIGMGSGMGGRWRQAPAVDGNIGTTRKGEKEQKGDTQHKESSRGSARGSQSSRPLHDDSQSLRGSVRSHPRGPDRQEDSTPKLRNGPQREHASQQRSPRAESQIAVRFGKTSNNQSQEHIVRALPSKERLANQASTASMGGSRAGTRNGSRVQSRTGSPGESYAF